MLDYLSFTFPSLVRTSSLQLFEEKKCEGVFGVPACEKKWKFTKVGIESKS